jgi:O-antigen/teichoic acid export membrane protein
MAEHQVDTARGILRNSSALFLVGLFAKGMGLIIGVLVARFLGPSATGLFAMLFGIALIAENLTALGLPEVLVREVAARPENAGSFYRGAIRIVLAISMIPALTFLIASFWFEHGDPTRNSLLVLCLSTPIFGIFAISQALLQGLERMQLLTWVTFLTRVASLVWLGFALWRGSDVEAAFISRLLFLLGAIAVFAPVLWRGYAGDHAEVGIRNLLVRSLPFALNRIIVDVATRLPALVLPPTLGLAKAGLFDSAERIRSSLSMTTGATMLGMMPAFARNFSGLGTKSEKLIAYSAKYVALTISMVATGIAVFAFWIIQILYGQLFADAVLPLQILVWSQVVFAVDSVLRQAMLAARHEFAAVRRALAGLLLTFVSIVLAAKFTDLPGVSIAILISATILLAYDLHFVVRYIARIEIFSFIAAPLLGAMLVGAALILVDQDAMLLRILVAFLGWILVLIIFRLLPVEELRLLRQILLARRTDTSTRD